MINLDAESREEAAISDFLSFGTSSPTLKDVEIFRVGDYRHKGKGNWSERDLDEMVKHFTLLKESGEHFPPIKSTHENDNRGLPLLGFIECIKRRGKELLADFRLVSDKVLQMFKDHAFRFRSAELHSNARPWIRPDGSRLGNVLRAVSMVPIPEVKGLADIAFTYAQEEDQGVSINYLEDSTMTEEEKKAAEAKAEEEKTEETPETEETKEETTEEKPDGAAAEETTEESSEETTAEEGKEPEAEENADTAESTDNQETDAEKEQAKRKQAFDHVKNLLDKGSVSEAKKILAQFAEDKEEDKDKEKMAEEDKKKLLDQAADMIKAGNMKGAMDLLKKAGYGSTYPGARALNDKVQVPVSGFSDDEILEDIRSRDQEAQEKRLLDVEKKAITSAFAEADAWIKNMVQSGKMTPAQVDDARPLAGPMGEALSYADGEGEDMKVTTVRDRFRKFVEAGTASIHLSEVAPAGGPDGGQASAESYSETETDKTVERINADASKPVT